MYFSPWETAGNHTPLPSPLVPIVAQPLYAE
jgi:hypothetical protein